MQRPARRVLGVRFCAALVLGGGLSLWAATFPAQAAGPAQAVQTQPLPVLNGNASSTIAVTNTFQQIWAQTDLTLPRSGCLVLNNSTNRQWVYFGTTPTKATAIPLEPATATNALGGNVSCGTGAGGAAQDQVWITGTAGDTFVATQE